MSVLARSNVKTFGHGPKVMMFAHGFGCDQNMWRNVTPAFAQDYKIMGRLNSTSSPSFPRKRESRQSKSSSAESLDSRFRGNDASRGIVRVSSICLWYMIILLDLMLQTFWKCERRLAQLNLKITGHCANHGTALQTIAAIKDFVH